MAGSNHCHPGGFVLGDEFHQRQTLFKIKEPHLTGLTDGENTLDAVMVVPLQKGLHSAEVNFVV